MTCPNRTHGKAVPSSTRSRDRRNPSVTALLVVPILLAFGCMADTAYEADVGIDAENFSEALVLSAIEDGKYRGAAFTPVTSTYYASEVAEGKNVAVWVSNGGVEAFLQADPDRTGTTPPLPVGTVIVREVLDASYRLEKLTLMAKGPPGTHPDAGDYWFGVTSLEGEVLEEAGVRLAGPLSECGLCHATRRQQDDYVFGVPQHAR